MRTKAQFLREWMRSLDEADSDKSWTGARHGKDFSGSPTFYAFVDMDYFGLQSPVGWKRSNLASAVILVPRGFVTDFASVPRLFWSIFPPIGRYGYAALFHDYVYWEQSTSRVEADAVFRETMKELGVPTWKLVILHGAVRLFGFRAWHANARAKATGEKRILRLFPTDLKVSWNTWKVTPGVFE